MTKREFDAHKKKIAALPKPLPIEKRLKWRKNNEVGGGSYSFYLEEKEIARVFLGNGDWCFFLCSQVDVIRIMPSFQSAKGAAFTAAVAELKSGRKRKRRSLLN